MFEEPIDDAELLRRAAGGSREALAEAARRYVRFVYAAALRQVRDAHLAEDVTQAVFVILAQKVAGMKPGTLLPAWLFTTTRCAAANAMKLQRRRQFHERRAAALRFDERKTGTGPVSGGFYERETGTGPVFVVEGMLDEALAELRETDRSAVLLSYMSGKSWREVAAALGTTEEAARKRVSRAVAQLRGIFARRGVVTSGAAIVAAMTASTEAFVPPALIGSVAAILTTGSVSTTGASGLIVKGAMHMMSWAQMKIAAAIGTAVMLGTLGAAGAMVMSQQSDEPAAGATTTSAKIRHGPLTATLDDGMTVELVAIARRGGKSGTWWNPDGSPSDRRFDNANSRDDPPHTHQIVVRFSGSTDYGANYIVPAGGWSSHAAMQGNVELEGFQIVTFALKEGTASGTVRVNVAAGEWQTLASTSGVNTMTVAGEDKGNASIGPLIDTNGQSAVTVADTLENHERRIIVVDQNGTEHQPTQRMSVSGGKMYLNSVTFPIPVDEVAQVRFMARPFDQFVEFNNVSFAAGQKTEPKVEVKGR